MLTWLKGRLAALKTGRWWTDALERSVWQMVQGMAAALLIAIEIEPFPAWQVILSYVAGGAATSLAISFLALPEPQSRSWLVATLWRLARTAVAALSGLMTAAMVSQGLFDAFAFDWGAALGLVAVTVATAFLKSAAVNVPELARSSTHSKR